MKSARLQTDKLKEGPNMFNPYFGSKQLPCKENLAELLQHHTERRHQASKLFQNPSNLQFAYPNLEYFNKSKLINMSANKSQRNVLGPI